MIQDRAAGLAFVALLVMAFVEAMDGFSLGAGMILLVTLFAPFAILGVFLTRGALRTQAGWDRPGAPNEVVVNKRD